jgi:hypothetical protein
MLWIIHTTEHAKKWELLFVRTKLKPIRRDRTVSIATGYELEVGEVGIRVPVGARFFFSPRCPDPTSYQMCTGHSFLGGGGGGWSGRIVKFTTHIFLASRSRIHGSIHPLFHTSSWRSAKLIKHWDNFTLPNAKIRRVRLTTLPPSVSRLSRENMGPSTSYNPMGLHGLLQG